MPSQIQVLRISDLNSIASMANTDYLIVYDSLTSTYKRIQKGNITIDMVQHGDDGHSVDYLKVDNNLDDLDDVSTAVTNLGLENALLSNNNLSEVNASDARNNLGIVFGTSVGNTVRVVSNGGRSALPSLDGSLLNNIRRQGGYTEVTTNITLIVGQNYIIREDVTATLPATGLTVGNEIEIVCGEMFGDTDVLDSYIDPNGENIEGVSGTLVMPMESFRLVYTGSSFGWSRL